MSIVPFRHTYSCHIDFINFKCPLKALVTRVIGEIKSERRNATLYAVYKAYWPLSKLHGRLYISLRTTHKIKEMA